MLNLWKASGRWALAGLVAGIGAIAYAQGYARPGTINYVEGNATLDGQPIAVKQLGSIELQPGHVLQTGAGKAEMLLTPGVFLRLGDNSAVKMVSPSLTDTQVELVRGEALVEVEQVAKENKLQVAVGSAATRMEKRGIYGFRTVQPGVAVYEGKAVIQVDDHTVDATKGDSVSFDAKKLKTQDFNRKRTDDLYAWSDLRSQYVAQANASTAQTVVMNHPSWWYGTGWYWNPWFDSWAFVPGAGFYGSPFGGFGFYSPAFWSYYAPYGGFGRYGGGVAGFRGGMSPGLARGGFGGGHR